MIAITNRYQFARNSMDTARLFKSGRSQAVSLPKEYRFAGQRVGIKRLGNGVLLYPIDAPWQLIEQALDMFEPGFEIVRDQPATQIRPEIEK